MSGQQAQSSSPPENWRTVCEDHYALSLVGVDRRLSGYLAEDGSRTSSRQQIISTMSAPGFQELLSKPGWDHGELKKKSDFSRHARQRAYSLGDEAMLRAVVEVHGAWYAGLSREPRKKLAEYLDHGEEYARTLLFLSELSGSVADLDRAIAVLEETIRELEHEVLLGGVHPDLFPKFELPAEQAEFLRDSWFGYFRSHHYGLLSKVLIAKGVATKNTEAFERALESARIASKHFVGNYNQRLASSVRRRQIDASTYKHVKRPYAKGIAAEGAVQANYGISTKDPARTNAGANLLARALAILLEDCDPRAYTEVKYEYETAMLFLARNQEEVSKRKSMLDSGAAAFKELLKVWRYETHPLYWRRVRQTLSDIYRELDREDLPNLKDTTHSLRRTVEERTSLYAELKLALGDASKDHAEEGWFTEFAKYPIAGFYLAQSLFELSELSFSNADLHLAKMVLQETNAELERHLLLEGVQPDQFEGLDKLARTPGFHLAEWRIQNYALLGKLHTAIGAATGDEKAFQQAVAAIEIATRPYVESYDSRLADRTIDRWSASSLYEHVNKPYAIGLADQGTVLARYGIATKDRAKIREGLELLGKALVTLDKKESALEYTDAKYRFESAMFGLAQFEEDASERKSALAYVAWGLEQVLTNWRRETHPIYWRRTHQTLLEIYREMGAEYSPARERTEALLAD